MTSRLAQLGQLYEWNAENAVFIGNVDQLVAEGKDPSAIIRNHCDELGQCRYPEEGDPNGYTARFGSMIQHPALRKHLDLRVNVVFDPGYYSLTPESVEHTRNLNRLAMMQTLDHPITLTTHADYIAYFESFPRPVLSQIFRQLAAIELSNGCVGTCLKVCSVRAIAGIQSQMPFETLEWIVDNFPAELQHSRPSLYFASDIQFYRARHDGAIKTGVDVLILFKEKLGYVPYNSISYHSKHSAPFLYECLVNDVSIDRISRLNSGRSDDDLIRLLEQINEISFQKRNHSISEEEADVIFIAFHKARKQYPAILGAQVSEDTPESTMERSMIACYHGALLRHDGLNVTIQRPATQNFPQQNLTFPVGADEKGVIRFPCHVHMTEDKVGYTNFVSRPHFYEYSAETGECLRDGHQERELGLLSRHISAPLALFSRIVDDFGVLEYGFYSETAQEVLDSPDFCEHITDVLNSVLLAVVYRLQLIDHYYDDPSMLAQIDQYAQYFLSDVINTLARIAGTLIHWIQSDFRIRQHFGLYYTFFNALGLIDGLLMRANEVMSQHGCMVMPKQFSDIEYHQAAYSQGYDQGLKMGLPAVPTLDLFSGTIYSKAPLAEPAVIMPANSMPEELQRPPVYVEWLSKNARKVA